MEETEKKQNQDTSATDSVAGTGATATPGTTTTVYTKIAATESELPENKSCNQMLDPPPPRNEPTISSTDAATTSATVFSALGSTMSAALSTTAAYAATATNVLFDATTEREQEDHQNSARAETSATASSNSQTKVGTDIDSAVQPSCTLSSHQKPEGEESNDRPSTSSASALMVEKTRTPITFSRANAKTNKTNSLASYLEADLAQYEDRQQQTVESSPPESRRRRNQEESQQHCDGGDTTANGANNDNGVLIYYYTPSASETESHSATSPSTATMTVRAGCSALSGRMTHSISNNNSPTAHKSGYNNNITRAHSDGSNANSSSQNNSSPSSRSQMNSLHSLQNQQQQQENVHDSAANEVVVGAEPTTESRHQDQQQVKSATPSVAAFPKGVDSSNFYFNKAYANATGAATAAPRDDHGTENGFSVSDDNGKRHYSYKSFNAVQPVAQREGADAGEGEEGEGDRDDVDAADEHEEDDSPSPFGAKRAFLLDSSESFRNRESSNQKSNSNGNSPHIGHHGDGEPPHNNKKKGGIKKRIKNAFLNKIQKDKNKTANATNRSSTGIKSADYFYHQYGRTTGGDVAAVAASGPRKKSVSPTPNDSPHQKQPQKVHHTHAFSAKLADNNGGVVKSAPPGTLMHPTRSAKTIQTLNMSNKQSTASVVKTSGALASDVGSGNSHGVLQSTSSLGAATSSSPQPSLMNSANTSLAGPSTSASSQSTQGTQNNFSYGGEFSRLFYNGILQLKPGKGEMRLSAEHPVYVLGRLYKGPEATQWVKLNVQHIQYFSYRNRLPSPLANGTDHDAGWGCMHRTGQMMMCEALRRTLKGAPYENGHPELITSLFRDTPEAPFGLYQLTLAGARHHIPVGQWLNPTCLAYSLRALVSAFTPAAASIGVVIGTDGVVKKSEILSLFQSGVGAALVVVPVMLGMERITAENAAAVEKLFELPATIGIVGGRPRQSLYFVGAQGETVFYLDPHTVQPAYISLDTLGATYGDRGFMSVTDMDPCMLLCFLLKADRQPSSQPAAAAASPHLNKQSSRESLDTQNSTGTSNSNNSNSNNTNPSVSGTGTQTKVRSKDLDRWEAELSFKVNNIPEYPLFTIVDGSENGKNRVANRPQQSSHSRVVSAAAATTTAYGSHHHHATKQTHLNGDDDDDGFDDCDDF